MDRGPEGGDRGREGQGEGEGSRIGKEQAGKRGRTESEKESAAA